MAKYNAIVAKALHITDAQAQEAAANSADKADISYITKNRPQLKILRLYRKQRGDQRILQQISEELRTTGIGKIV